MTRFRILVFHRAEGFVHLSIPEAVAAIEALGAAHDIEVHATDDPATFSRGALAPYAALVFVHTSGDVLPRPEQRSALQDYIAAGGGYFGIHAASSMGPDVRRDWPWYRSLVGAAFTSHTVARVYSDHPVEPRLGLVHAGRLAEAPDDAERVGTTVAVTSWEPAIVRVEDGHSPAGRGLVDGEVRIEEWYAFDENPRPSVHVVATVDESTYDPLLSAMGDDHPIVWWRQFAGGRTVYNAMGHSSGTWRDPSFLRGILGGIELAAGALEPTP